MEKKYPLVAIRYLELLNDVSDEWHRRTTFFESVFSKAKLCDPESPIRATKEFCDMVINREDDNDFPPPPCKPARNEGDIERYIECLKKRIP